MKGRDVPQEEEKQIENTLKDVVFNSDLFTNTLAELLGKQNGTLNEDDGLS